MIKDSCRCIDEVNITSLNIDGNTTDEVYDNSCFLPTDNTTDCQQFEYDKSIFTNTIVSQVFILDIFDNW